LADLLDRIVRLGAKSVALTFVLAEKDRTSATALQSALKEKFGFSFDTSQWPTKVLDNDALLTETLSSGPFVLGFELMVDKAAAPGNDCAPHPLDFNRTAKHPPAPVGTDQFHRAQGAICNLPGLERAVLRSGFLNGQSDLDGRLRRLPLLMQWKQEFYPNLALAAVMAVYPDNAVSLQHSQKGTSYLCLGNREIPMDAQGHVRLNFAATTPDPRHVSATQILADRASMNDFQQRIVFVGLSAAGLNMTYRTPGRQLMSAAEVHARLAQTLLQGQFTVRPQSMLVVEMLVALVLGTFLTFSVARMEVGQITLIVFASIAVLQGTALLLFRSRGLLFSPLLPASVLTLNAGLLLLIKYTIRQKVARRQAHNAMELLRLSEKNLNAIIQTIPDIVFRLDTMGRITFISPAVAKYRQQPDTLMGVPVLDFVVPEQRELVMHKLQERRTGARATIDLEVRLLLHTGDSEGYGEGRFFHVSTEGIYSQDKPSTQGFIGTQGIARDIHHRKKLERQLEQAKKMEAIGNLAAGVAHDLNNILSGLVAYPELLLAELPSDSPLRHMVEIMRQSGQRAADMVQDMLCIARRNVHDYEIIQLNEVVSTYLKMPEFQKIAHNHPPIAVRTQLDGELAHIRGSSVHLSKLIMNLVNNAAEAMPTGGDIRLITCNRCLDTHFHAYELIPTGDYVVLSVIDQGVGIPP
jgi:PAS domain S-box-containing protein